MCLTTFCRQPNKDRILKFVYTNNNNNNYYYNDQEPIQSISASCPKHQNGKETQRLRAGSNILNSKENAKIGRNYFGETTTLNSRQFFIYLDPILIYISV